MTTEDVVEDLRAYRYALELRSPAYFAAWVGYVWETTMRRYIEHQWDAVLAS